MKRLSYTSVQSFKTAMQVHFGKEVDIQSIDGPDREERRRKLLHSLQVHDPKKKEVSMSHSDEVTVLAHSINENDSVGVDLEENKEFDPKIKKFFVSEKEEKEIVKEEKDILMIWSIKEAILKADPNNKDCKISHYNIESFENGVGVGSKKSDTEAKFKFLHQLTPEGFHLAMAKKENGKDLQKKEKKHA